MYYYLNHSNDDKRKALNIVLHNFFTRFFSRSQRLNHKVNNILSHFMWLKTMASFIFLVSLDDSVFEHVINIFTIK